MPEELENILKVSLPPEGFSGDHSKGRLIFKKSEQVPFKGRKLLITPYIGLIFKSNS